MSSSKTLANSLKKPVPLYPPYIDLCEFYLEDYPELDKVFSSNESWWLEQFNWGKLFLTYIGRNKSTHTYGRLLKRKNQSTNYVNLTYSNMLTFVGNHQLLGLARLIRNALK